MMTQTELEEKLTGLGVIDEQTKKSVVCSLIGHSLIQTYCFGYYYCGRCGQQLGDSLVGTYPQAGKVVVIGHNCKVCRSNYRKCTWGDKYMVPKPFSKRIKENRVD